MDTPSDANISYRERPVGSHHLVYLEGILLHPDLFRHIGGFLADDRYWVSLSSFTPTLAIAYAKARSITLELFCSWCDGLRDMHEDWLAGTLADEDASLAFDFVRRERHMDDSSGHASS